MAKTAIYVPTRGYVWHETAAALGAAMPSYVRCTTGVVDARNLITGNFLQSDCEILVMCDDDVVPPEIWPRIIDHVAEGRADVCAAVVPIAMEGTVFLPNVFQRDDSLLKGYRLSTDYIRLTGLHEVDAVGTGLIAIHRRVMEDRRMEHPWASSFQTGMGEDVSFCRRAKKARWRVCVDFDVWCDHMVTFHANGVANAYMEVVNRVGEDLGERETRLHL